MSTVVRAARLEGKADRLAEIARYLPENYEAITDGADVLVFGVDSHGWTLDGYVIPRLASGMLWAKEEHFEVRDLLSLAKRALDITIEDEIVAAIDPEWREQMERLRSVGDLAEIMLIATEPIEEEVWSLGPMPEGLAERVLEELDRKAAEDEDEEGQA
jgi:hypothetical protein